MSKQSDRKAQQLKAAKAAAKSMPSIGVVNKSQSQNPSGAETDKEPKQGILNWVKTHKVTTTLGATFIFSLGGPLGYLSTNPKIFYFPAGIICILFCWVVLSGTHKFVESKSDKDVPPQTTNPLPQLAKAAELVRAEQKISFLSTNLSTEEKNDIENLVGQINKISSDKSATNQTCPGFSWNLLIRLNPPDPGRKNFIADAGERFDKNRISIFADEDKNLCFRVIGDDGSSTILQVHQFYDTFLFDNKMWLACEYGMTDNFCFMRMYVNGKMVAENLHASAMHSADQWLTFKNPVIPASDKGSVIISDGIVFGQDMNFDNGGKFTLAAIMLFKAALPPNQMMGVGRSLAWIDGLRDR